MNKLYYMVRAKIKKTYEKIEYKSNEYSVETRLVLAESSEDATEIFSDYWSRDSMLSGYQFELSDIEILPPLERHEDLPSIWM